MPHGDVRREVPVGTLLHLGAQRHTVRAAAGAVRPEAVAFCIRVRGEQRAARRVVAVRVRDDHVRDGFSRGGGQQRLDVRFVRRAGIDNGHGAAANDVGAGAVERERARVLGDDAPNAGRHFGDLSVAKVERALERNGDHGLCRLDVPVADCSRIRRRFGICRRFGCRRSRRRWIRVAPRARPQWPRERAARVDQGAWVSSPSPKVLGNDGTAVAASRSISACHLSRRSRQREMPGVMVSAKSK